MKVVGNKVSTYEAGIHTLEMAPEHQSIKARLFNRVATSVGAYNMCLYMFGHIAHTESELHPCRWKVVRADCMAALLLQGHLTQ